MQRVAVQVHKVRALASVRPRARAPGDALDTWFRKALDGKGQSAVLAGIRQRHPDPRRSYWFWMAVVVTGVVLLLAGAGVWLFDLT